MPSSCAPSFRHSKEGERSCPWAEPALLLSSSSPVPSLLSPMEKLLHLTLAFLAASCAAENVTVVAAWEGDTISVNCSYDARQWWREKSWCRQLDQSRCQRVVSAPPVWLLWLPFPGSRRGATSIRDNARAGLLTVTMRRLRREDAGLYQCRTDFLGETRSLRKVQVEVLAADLVTHVPEEPRAVQGISRSLPDVDFTVFYILAGFLVAKFMVAVLVCAVVRSRKNRERGQNPGLGEQQVLPLPADLGHDGIGLPWESSA
ncbi:triggering receptor expressed on myeloid cells 2 isoform X2 [Vidua chalybeata]|uniref:triggering receptor expressed on myeloid cells 2 isoform X2 n=1 Tax=Vidua chalybeata TaxID=81927 RepID=UPI0023A867C2|nr:triggering receptor expressed on myeloid cells 2 isoform X2 [Vidua chalybeata]